MEVYGAYILAKLCFFVHDFVGKVIECLEILNDQNFIGVLLVLDILGDLLLFSSYVRVFVFRLWQLGHLAWLPAEDSFTFASCPSMGVAPEE